MRKLKFFADQCVPNAVIESIQNLGFDVLILKKYIPKDSEDSKVILEAQKRDSILISLNGDFADIITYPPPKFKGIIAIQLRNHPKVIGKIMELLNKYLLKNPNMEHYKGKLFLIEPHRIRVKY